MNKIKLGTSVATYTTKSFILNVAPDYQETNITFQMLTADVRTGSIPQTLSILKKELPGVLKTRCFNDKGLTFEDEVIDTEIGHMFEHILLQNLCEIKQKEGNIEIRFRGLTEWNWNKDPRGLYRIKVTSECDYSYILEEAIKRSIQLTEEILGSK